LPFPLQLGIVTQPLGCSGKWGFRPTVFAGLKELQKLAKPLSARWRIRVWMIEHHGDFPHVIEEVAGCGGAIPATSFALSCIFARDRPLITVPMGRPSREAIWR
jgi:hypothetical protein